MVKISLKSPSNKCFRCTSELILVKSWTETSGTGKFPQKITIYRCSNDECQKEKDKEEEKRKKALEDKEKRMEENAKKRKELKIKNNKLKNEKLKNDKKK